MRGLLDVIRVCACLVSVACVDVCVACPRAFVRSCVDLSLVFFVFLSRFVKSFHPSAPCV